MATPDHALGRPARPSPPPHRMSEVVFSFGSKPTLSAEDAQVLAQLIVADTTLFTAKLAAEINHALSADPELLLDVPGRVCRDLCPSAPAIRAPALIGRFLQHCRCCCPPERVRCRTGRQAPERASRPDLLRSISRLL